MTDAILTLNAGSSSLKLALFAISEGGTLAREFAGQVEGIGTEPHFLARDTDGKVLEERRWDSAARSHEAFLPGILEFVDRHLGGERLWAAGHRVVHGGADHAAPVRIDRAVLDALEALVPLAPLHQPHNLAPIAALLNLRPDMPQVACFDTAFHHTMPKVATRVALPHEITAHGIRRYGFHGLSYAYIAERLGEVAPELAKGRVIVAHLGSGASLCAMRGGHSIDTTMGFTPLDGLVMGTRCGTLDPGVVLFMQQTLGMSATQVETMLYQNSGLRGVSGFTSDMRKLHESQDPRARDAIELFVFRLVRELGGLIATLGGIDGLVFTAGIGEHDAAIRAAVCERLDWLGVRFDDAANRDGGALISTSDSRVAVRVVATDEEAMIGRETFRTLRPR